MKNSSLTFWSLYLLVMLPLAGFARAAASDPTDSLLLRLSLGLILTENYEEAEDCFAKLAENHPADLTIINNRGVNLAMWGLSLLQENEATELIRYVFPFEVKPNSGKRGNIEDAHKFITGLFEMAAEQFERSVQLNPEDAGGYLNLASIQAILSRWLNDPALLRKAFENSKTALSKAPEGSGTKGNCLIVQGIISDYLGNTARRDELFDLAERQYQSSPDKDLVSLAQRNMAVAKGGAAVFLQTSGEKYDVFVDSPEAIDGISLDQLMNNGSLNSSREIANTEKAKLYGIEETQSTLYLYYKDVSRYLFFHQTGESYSGKSSKGISIGDNEAFVRLHYGNPVRVQAAQDGKFLLYKKANLIFFIGNNNQVQSWIIWRGKGG